LMRDP